MTGKEIILNFHNQNQHLHIADDIEDYLKLADIIDNELKQSYNRGYIDCANKKRNKKAEKIKRSLN